jgi:D-3-phosphoglycerate dehydrogenase / 2-oxoglutarate reductase
MTEDRDTKMHIVVADQLPASAIDLLRSVRGWSVDARTQRHARELARDLAEADAIIVRSATKVTAALMAAAPRLRVIARAGTGVDNVDVAAATERGIVVMNAPGANSVSVAELALALMLSLSRAIPAADAAMKRGVWDKRTLTGAELRGKILGIIGLGRIGQAVAVRARSFGMQLVAHDPFISEQVAGTLGIELLSLDEACATADYLTLHVPATPETRHLLNAARLAHCKAGVRIVNTARGELIDEGALADAIESGQVAGAALDVFEIEPPVNSRLTKMPQVIATPHIAASTVEAQELVGMETAIAVRDFLREGAIRNAVNFPTLPGEEYTRIRPFMLLAERMGALASQIADGRTHGVGIRYYGPLVNAHAELLASAVVAGLLRPMLSSNVTVVNARAIAAERGIEVVESRSSRPRDFANLLSVKLHTTGGERWIEGTVFEADSPRLTQLDGVDVEAPLDGTLLVIRNDDQPGVIGEVGTILGRHGLNIGSFALGRGRGGAVGVVNLDQHGGSDAENARALEELRAVRAIKDVRLVTLVRAAG